MSQPTYRRGLTTFSTCIMGSFGCVLVFGLFVAINFERKVEGGYDVADTQCCPGYSTTDCISCVCYADTHECSCFDQYNNPVSSCVRTERTNCNGEVETECSCNTYCGSSTSCTCQYNADNELPSCHCLSNEYDYQCVGNDACCHDNCYEMKCCSTPRYPQPYACCNNPDAGCLFYPTKCPAVRSGYCNTATGVQQVTGNAKSGTNFDRIYIIADGPNQTTSFYCDTINAYADYGYVDCVSSETDEFNWVCAFSKTVCGGVRWKCCNKPPIPQGFCCYDDVSPKDGECTVCPNGYPDCGGEDINSCVPADDGYAVCPENNYCSAGAPVEDGNDAGAPVVNGNDAGAPVVNGNDANTQDDNDIDSADVEDDGTDEDEDGLEDLVGEECTEADICGECPEPKPREEDSEGNSS